MSANKWEIDKRRALDYEDAIKYGVNAAFILYRLKKLIVMNANRGLNYHDGRYWSYDTYASIKKWLPFMSESSIKRAVKTLKDADVIKSIKNPLDPWSNMRWYTVMNQSFPAPEESEQAGEAFGENNAVLERGSKWPDRSTQNEPMDLSKMTRSSLYNQTQSDDGDKKVFDFVRVYNLYPKKRGRSDGLKLLRRKIKSKEKYAQFEEAVNNYRRVMEAQKKPVEYMLKFSSFVREWEDWIDPAIVAEGLGAIGRLEQFLGEPDDHKVTQNNRSRQRRNGMAQKHEGGDSY